jgi:single-strand DNA-binding protein
MNNASLIGRLVRDVELRRTPQGTAVASFTLAVDRLPAKDTKERQTDFIPVVVWRQTAEFCSKYFTKGVRVGVTGRIQVRTYEDKDGKRVYATEIVAEHVYFADGKQNSSYAPPSTDTGATATASESGGGFAEIDEDDGNLPF